MNFFQRRRARKEAKEIANQARHLLNMRGDLLGPAEVTSIREAVNRLLAAAKAGDWALIIQAKSEITALIDHQTSSIPFRGGVFKENFEVIVVAVVVAMGLRAYFIQPFKIPTGSMQPTLYGITSEIQPRTMLDRFPLSILKFASTGEWYSERVARASGMLGEGVDHPQDSSVKLFRIGGKIHRIPKEVMHDEYGEPNPLFHNPQRVVEAGELLWAGVTRRGDHLFVNKVIWNFRKPCRDEIMVFKTDRIPTLEPGTHYIKRMCGLPGDGVSIVPPNLVINQSIVRGFEGIDKVSSGEGLYAGYQLAGHLKSPNLVWTMRGDEYFALGDNTRNSRDSRYWGPVPEKNLVGPAVFVYWPLSSRWGLIR